MTESQRTWGLRAAMAAVVIGLVAWLASCTEWAEVEVPVPPRGEAARNPLYATQQLARRLGATVATPKTLARMPPPGATLLLTSWHWDLFPERARQLRDWVEAGGHLVLFTDNLRQEQLKGWLPIKLMAPPSKAHDDNGNVNGNGNESDRDEAEEDDDGPAPDPAPNPVQAPRSTLPCIDATEPAGVTPHYAEGQRYYRLCGVVESGWTLTASTPVLWSLDGRRGPVLLRAARGRGDVTVIQPWALLNNDRVLKADNGLAAVAALQARPGATLWFVTEEARPSLLAWLWHEAWVALVLAGAALALALWRGARRFGPLVAKAPTGRRSMAEQIAGTAQFLRQQGPAALLSAEVRALDAAARLHIRGYDQLDRGQRAAAIARHTGQDAAALGLALDKRLAGRRAELPAKLETLETARRLLVQRRTPSRPSNP
ncbi:MAG: DUF4350 domain-containing protein [Rhizobacter sp.]|nr:DUF4350 domain-containing protein [Rhizobacter sp.]